MVGAWPSRSAGCIFQVQLSCFLSVPLLFGCLVCWPNRLSPWVWVESVSDEVLACIIEVDFKSVGSRVADLFFAANESKRIMDDAAENESLAIFSGGGAGYPVSDPQRLALVVDPTRLGHGDRVGRGDRAL